MPDQQHIIIGTNRDTGGGVGEGDKEKGDADEEKGDANNVQVSAGPSGQR